MKPDFDKILLDLSYRIPSGIVDLTKQTHLNELVIILEENGVYNPEAIRYLMEKATNDSGETFTATKKDTGETVAFKSKAAKDAAIKSGTHIEPSKSDKKSEQPSTQKLSADDFKTSAEKNVEKQTSQTSIPQSAEKAKSLTKNEPAYQPSSNDEPATKVYSDREIQKEVEKLDDIDGYLKDSDADTKERVKLLKYNWNKYMKADTKEQKIEALRELAENNLIEAHMGGKKIYLSPNTALPYKHLTGGGSEGTTVTREMNELIKEAGIEVPARGNAKDRALADMSGKHNEAGVVAYLFPSEENKKGYESTQKSFRDLGGDEGRFDEINKNAAEAIKSQLPEGVEITGAQQVGGVGKTALAQLGIDPKVDPTDLIVKYKDADGTEKIMKISAKTYSDPKNITMKNSGTGNAGVTYLGELGRDIDAQISNWREEFAWDDSMDDEEKADKKRGLKQTYLKAFGDKMVQLTNSEQGQGQLSKLWKDVHGCGQDVYTQIINKNTGKVQIKSPDYYCDPQPPFKVEYDGVKLVINMGGQDNNFLQIDMKTEDKGSPKLLFRHRSK
jgi:hypothetical protein